MNSIEQIRQRRQQAHQQLLGMKSKVYQAFLGMEPATYADGSLPKQTKELISAVLILAAERRLAAGFGRGTGERRPCFSAMQADYKSALRQNENCRADRGGH